MLKDSASYASSKTIDEFYHAGNMLRNKRQGKSKIESIVKLSVVHPKCRKQTDGMKLKRRRVIVARTKNGQKHVWKSMASGPPGLENIHLIHLMGLLETCSAEQQNMLSLQH